MHKRTALPIVIACAAWACGSSDQGSDVPPFSGTLPNFGMPAVAGQKAVNPASVGAPSASGVQVGGNSEAQGNPSLAAAASSGVTTGAPLSTASTASPAAAGAGMLDVTIQAETLNQA